MTTETELIHNVTRGAAWLDAVHPGWERSIDLSTFDIEHPCLCVLGQVVGNTVSLSSGNFREGEELNGYQTVYQTTYESSNWMTDHGFCAFRHIDGLCIGRRNDWKLLQQTWINLLKERFDTGNLSDIETW